MMDKKTWCVCQRGGSPDANGYFIDTFSDEEIKEIESQGYGLGYRIAEYCDSESEANDLLSFWESKK